MKPCTKCAETLPLESFSKDARTKDGRKSACKECVKRSDSRYRDKPGIKERRNAQCREYTAIWQRQEDVMAKRRARQQNRRSSAGHMPTNTLKLLVEAYGDSCMNPDCVTGEKVTIDHIVPLCMGGTHDFENLQLLCGRCNSSKGRWSIVDYRICFLTLATVK